ncbi:DNA-binding protein [Klebsiella pneumoniae]|nr:DNA-binding protein [Klebsiella pneumoniae]
MTTEEKGRLTPTQWAEAEALWASGEFTLTQLEERFGVRRETLSRRFKKKGVEKGRDLAGRLVSEALKSDAEIRTRERLDKIENRRDQYDKWAFTIAGLTMREIAEARREERSLTMVEGNIKALQRASVTLNKCWDVASRALNMDKTDTVDDDMPALMFGELTDSQVRQLRAAEEDVEDIAGDEELEALEEEIVATTIIPEEGDK